MAKGTMFGSLHSSADLHLIQQKIEISPASPKLNLIDIPGADGTKDLTEALGVGVKYNDREIVWTFALYPGADWSAKQSEVSNAINGKRLQIVPDGIGDWYFDGRIKVDSYASDKLLQQITVKAICKPYKLASSISTVSRSDLSTSYKTLNLSIGAMPLIPEVTVEQETSLKWGDTTATVSAGTHLLPGLYMSGDQQLKAKVTSGTGTISVSWREGSL
nr:MAG TPA: distal tail protein [Caudoviricetes sp.]